jgi:two-component system NtrC family sensor kinase
MGVRIMSKEIASQPLQRKVAITLLLVFAAFSVLSYAILTTVIAPAFDDLDLATAKTNLVRAERAIQSDIDNLAAVTADWAPWDDIHDYVRGVNPGFFKSNLNRPTLDNLGLDVLAVFATERKLLWSQMLVDAEERSIDELGIFGVGDVAADVLAEHSQMDGATVGLLHTKLGPMLISSMPILRSDDSGPIAGAVVMGLFLNEARVTRLRERTEVDFMWRPIDEFASAQGIDRLSITAGDIQVVTSAQSISSYKMVTDIFAEPLFVLDVDTPRRISAVGDQTVNAAMLFLVVTGIFVTFVIWYLLRGAILKPIAKLADHMKKIRKSGDLSHKLDLQSDDEIGALAAEFDNLTFEVHEARKALLFQSFKAGKADTAAEVLHNIRNAMTPMINGVERLSKAFKVTDGLRVDQATAALAEPDCPPQKASKFIQYIDASFEHVKSVNAEASEDMKMVTAQARQVEGILADQEKFTKAAPMEEDIVVDEVVGEATHVIPKEAAADVDVDVDDKLTRFRVRAHRIGLLQVLGNLILNAYESIERGNKANGRISLTASDDVLDDKPMVRVTVRDNGTGFDDDMSEQIFQRGFSSKSKGTTTGLGLHWCANAVAGMGGRIFAESQGTGQGAEFHVLLPAAQGG